MATLNLGRIKPVFRGAYSGSTAYVVDDIVTHGNESFICIQAHGAGTQATSVTAYWTKLAAKGTDGTDVGTTITTQGDILFRDGSGLQRLASSGHGSKTLQMNSGATAPEWVTVTPPSADIVKVLTVSTSVAATTVSIDNVFSATYSNYRVIMRHIKPATDNQSLYCRWIDNSGAVMSASNYRSLCAGGENYSGGSNNTQNTREWDGSYANITPAGNTISNSGATGGAYYDIMVYSPFSTVIMPFMSGTYANAKYSSFNHSTGTFSFFYNTAEATAFRGFQLYWSGGGNFQTANSTGGSVTVYGYKE